MNYQWRGLCTCHLGRLYATDWKFIPHKAGKGPASMASPGGHCERIWRGAPEENGRNGHPANPSEWSPRTSLNYLCRGMCSSHLGRLYAPDWRLIPQKSKKGRVKVAQATILKGFGGVDPKEMAGTDAQPTHESCHHVPV